MASSETVQIRKNSSPDAPQQKDLDRCVHCGLCLNACPTYRELGVEMDSPRGRIYQMVQVATGQMEIGPAYMDHMEKCLACRACETACPSGVQYGKLIEAARTDIEAHCERPWHVKAVRWLVFDHLLPSRTMLTLAGAGLWAYQKTGLQSLVRATGILKALGIDKVEALTPTAEMPTFFRHYGKVFPAEGEQRKRVALLGGCMANVCFAGLHEATVRVLQKNGCEVTVPEDQTCCGALAVHSGLRDNARQLARQNIDALLGGKYDAILTNTAGCGSTLKEYHELLEHDAAYHGKAEEFSRLVKDVNEFLVALGLRPPTGEVKTTVTYQDSCHLAHGQKIKAAPRQILKSIPGLVLKEMPYADLCCGSAGIYNVVQNELAMEILEKKMGYANSTNAPVIATANPGCLLQLRAGAKLYGKEQQVVHVMELLDRSYQGK